MNALPAPASATIAALAAHDLERKAEEAAKASAEEAEIERRAGPAPRAHKFWAGGAVNLVRYDEGATAGLLTQGTLDRQSTGFKVFGGYQFSRHLGVEVGYASLGEADYSGSFQGTPVVGGKLKITGFDAALVGSLAVSEKAILFGKVGAFMWEAKANDVTGGVPFSTSTDGTNAMLGLGVAYALSPATALRVELESRRAADEAVNLIAVGLELRF
jgi:OOP family OmpA-OmpF porin